MVCWSGQAAKKDTGVNFVSQIWKSKVLTLFPEMFPGPLGLSLAGQGLRDGIWSLEIEDLRDYASGRHSSVDDAPFGGGPGMVMRPDVIDRAINAIRKNAMNLPLLVMTPRGLPLDQARIRKFVDGPGMIILCGRFEGIDQRVIEVCNMEEVSVGDVVLSGGEPAAFVLLDACVRLLDGILSNRNSIKEESFEFGLLEHPHYTRPQEWKGRRVPEVLTSGHHRNIERWRQAQAEAITKKRRPDMWSSYFAGKKRKTVDN